MRISSAVRGLGAWGKRFAARVVPALRRVPKAIWLLAGLVLFPMLLLSALIRMNEWLRKPSTFSLSVRTEVAEFETTNLASNRWYLPEADVVMGRGMPWETENESQRLQAFEGFVDIGPRARVRIERTGSGPLRLALHDAQGDDGILDPDAPTATTRSIPVVSIEELSDEESTWYTADSAYLEVTPGRAPLNWALIGVGNLGDEVQIPAAAESAPLLLSGSVVVMARRLFSDLLYPVMQFDLVLGDEVRVLDELGQSVEKSCVFMMSGVTDDDSPGIEVACQASGRTLEIVRFGKRVGRLEPKPWDIIINEPSFLALFPLLVAALFGLVQSVLFYAFRGNRLLGRPRRDAGRYDAATDQ